MSFAYAGPLEFWEGPFLQILPGSLSEILYVCKNQTGCSRSE